MVSADTGTSSAGFDDFFRGVAFVKVLGDREESVVFYCVTDVVEKQIQDVEVMTTVSKEESGEGTFVRVPKQSFRDI